MGFVVFVVAMVGVGVAVALVEHRASMRARDDLARRRSRRGINGQP